MTICGGLSCVAASTVGDADALRVTLKEQPPLLRLATSDDATMREHPAWARPGRAVRVVRPSKAQASADSTLACSAPSDFRRCLLCNSEHLWRAPESGDKPGEANTREARDVRFARCVTVHGKGRSVLMLCAGLHAYAQSLVFRHPRVCIVHLDASVVS
eukprot:7056648-Prymnesium_polylepis.1